MTNSGMNEKKKLAKMIQTYSFAVNEAVLYLDTHPRSQKALKYYEKYAALCHSAMEQYEEKYGPLTMYGGGGGDVWSWVIDPFPWEE